MSVRILPFLFNKRLGLKKRRQIKLLLSKYSIRYQLIDTKAMVLIYEVEQYVRLERNVEWKTFLKNSQAFKIYPNINLVVELVKMGGKIDDLSLNVQDEDAEEDLISLLNGVTRGKNGLAEMPIEWVIKDFTFSLSGEFGVQQVTFNSNGVLTMLDYDAELITNMVLVAED
ncbi:hypothetical protein LA429_06170 [Weissella cibaria]|uniref:hypothetical protein n=1 Tax=Weissella cibaria TaxID=137591 RepID=UPI001E37EC6F|nr:hypothetical protein [Weissella cibaria]MCC6122320.1 hypothetical protein [Weissella cibaria]MCT0952604.1 hypothetical protein [Weissella cibaria]